MSVLLVRLAGPLQSWGSAARFARRSTENAPTKSGVLGLLAAALGRTRQQDLSDLAALRFGIRIDQPGTRLRDFQTAHHADSGKAMPLSERFYLADAVFVAGVEGDEKLLHHVYEALLEPRFLPYLGRRSCPPSRPLTMDPPYDAPLDARLEEALRDAPWQASDWYADQITRSVGRDPRESREHAEPLDIQIDCPPGEEPHVTLRDVPLSFDPRHRRYGLRGLRGGHVPRPVRSASPTPPPPHDPTAVLRPATPPRTTRPRNDPPREP